MNFKETQSKCVVRDVVTKDTTHTYSKSAQLCATGFQFHIFNRLVTQTPFFLIAYRVPFPFGFYILEQELRHIILPNIYIANLLSR
jgi:hypothetical protein